MAALTVESASITGESITPATPNAGGDTFANTGIEKLIVYNNSGGTLTFDVVTTMTVETTLTVDDRSYSIPDGAWRYIGSFSTSIYDTTVTIENYSATAGVYLFVIT